MIRGADLPLEETKKGTISHSQVLALELQDVSNARNIMTTLVLKAANRLRSKDLYTKSILLTAILKNKEFFQKRIKAELSNDSSNILKYSLKDWDELVEKII